MFIIGSGLNGFVVCQKCGQLFDQPDEPITHPICHKCGVSGWWGRHLDGGSKIFVACEEPEKCYFDEGRPHAHYSGNLDSRYMGKGHEYLDQRLSEGWWVLYGSVKSTGVNLELNHDQPETSPWLVTFNKQIHGYQIWYAFPAGQENLYKAVKAYKAFIKAGANKARQEFINSLEGKKAVDNGTSRFSQHAGRDYRRRVLDEMGWVCWESHRNTHRGASTTDYWFEPTLQGVRDLLFLLGSPNLSKGRSPEGSLRVFWDEPNSTLYVEAGSEGLWIGKGGRQIRKLSDALGRFVKVKPIEVSIRIGYKIGKAYLHGASHTAIRLTVYNIYVCGEYKFEVFRLEHRGGERILREELAKIGILGNDFPLYFCQEMYNEAEYSWDDPPERRAVREGKLFNGKTVEEWYGLFFEGKAFEEYVNQL